MKGFQIIATSIETNLYQFAIWRFISNKKNTTCCVLLFLGSAGNWMYASSRFS